MFHLNHKFVRSKIEYKLDYCSTFDDIVGFSNFMSEQHDFANFLKEVFKWFVTRPERDENDGPKITNDCKTLSINMLNTITTKLMEHGTVLTKGRLQVSNSK